MKFVLFFRLEESNTRKMKNMHHIQVVYEFYAYIQYNLVNIYQFVRNKHHAFDYEHVNNNLYFVLTLYTEIIGKFKTTLRSLDWEQSNPLILVKP